ncbi:hypothetical protein QA649_05095 [Bradyrhizobium sp. CB1717]|uniref:hypothetical protein n=1 Tax=Bradyrhizobium sp. CB1717 TaxID=3039154 RepID=UPI0024B0E201|nr:hypothetical protein [Bradyrhizobium sp. CB1717]WFU25587.1 hypothetical protein QA649_05095 [Bradyrhizobium sp. CB1717]
MGVPIINTFVVRLLLLFLFKIVRFNVFWKLSPSLVSLPALLGLLIPGLGHRSAQRGLWGGYAQTQCDLLVVF